MSKRVRHSYAIEAHVPNIQSTCLSCLGAKMLKTQELASQLMLRSVLNWVRLVRYLVIYLDTCSWFVDIYKCIHICQQQEFLECLWMDMCNILSYTVATIPRMQLEAKDAMITSLSIRADQDADDVRTNLTHKPLALPRDSSWMCSIKQNPQLLCWMCTCIYI